MKVEKGTLQQLRSQGIYLYDWSMLRNFLSCPYFYYLRHELNLIRKDEGTNYGLHFGIGIHAALDVWFVNKDDNAAIQAFVNYFTPYEEPMGFTKTGKESAATYSIIYGCSLLEAYFRTNINDDRKVSDRELPLAEELCEGIYWAGRVDKIIEPRSYVYTDYKTSKYFNNFRVNPNPQFLGYKFLVERLTGEHVTGELDMLGVSKSKSPDELLRKEPFDYTNYQLERWKASTICHINAITKHRADGFWPQAWNCDPFFRECPYAPLCTLTTKEAFEPLLNSMFVKEYWDPFHV